MNILFNLSLAVSVGITIGFIGGAIKSKIIKSYTQEKIEATKKILEKISNILKYIVLFLLAQGVVWCTYFLILGVISPASAEYANNVSELIVAVLTVISIIFAFFEFLRRTDK
ncbi:transporter [uncultured Anaerofustis sp.]|uniref:transporter n=1 Tax=uncultured Anaerofustis sp. TaxID=904996 RepID=UPI0025FE2102|nr:transporter [uncultured Anaerofustis sp.]